MRAGTTESSAFSQVVIVAGNPASSPRILSCTLPARLSGSPSDRTTSEVAVEGIWSSGRKNTGLGSSVRVFYFPSSTTPATSIRCPSWILKYPPTAGQRSKHLARKLPTTTATLALTLVMQADVPARQQHNTGSLKVSGRNAVSCRFGYFVRFPQVGRVPHRLACSLSRGPGAGSR